MTFLVFNIFGMLNGLMVTLSLDRLFEHFLYASCQSQMEIQ